MATWPETLPPPYTGSLNISPPDNVIRSGMDTGPAKVRRRTTANITPHEFVMRLSKAQAVTLYNFHKEDTFSGADEFDYYDEFLEQNIKARFVSPPKIGHLEADTWTAQVSLEILP